MNEKKLFSQLEALDKQNQFDQINSVLSFYQEDEKLTPAVSYYRGTQYQFGRGVDIDYDVAVSYYKKAYEDGKHPLAAYKLSKVFSSGTQREEDINKANALLKEAADKFVVPAMNDLGVCYISGRGDIKQNVNQALELWNKCIKKGYPLSEINLAYFNINNSDKKKVIKKGFETLEKYVKENNREALYYYALVLIDGIKVEPNDVMGISYMKASASYNYIKAINYLGDAYYHGKHVKVDHKLSMFYYERSALLKDLDACLFCSYAYLKGDGVERNVQKSLDYCYIAAKGGHIDAQIALGDRYYYGDSVKNDFHVALHWYKQAADQNSGYAYQKIADMLIDGQGVKKDTKKAFALYNKALELGNKNVYLPLGRMHETGTGTKRNKDKALENYLKGYKRHNPHAAFYYAELVSSGKINGIKDYQNAAPAYEMAANADIVEACKKTGECYLKGLGVVKDLEKSLDFYLKASLLGDTESTIMVNIIKKQIDLNAI